jgi:hypothetical protein
MRQRRKSYRWRGRKTGIPAITFGWFRHDDKRSVRRPIQGFALHTEYSLLAHGGEESAAARKFISFVVNLKKSSGRPAAPTSTATTRRKR